MAWCLPVVTGQSASCGRGKWLLLAADERGSSPIVKDGVTIWQKGVGFNREYLVSTAA